MAQIQNRRLSDFCHQIRRKIFGNSAADRKCQKQKGNRKPFRIPIILRNKFVNIEQSRRISDFAEIKSKIKNRRDQRAERCFKKRNKNHRHNSKNEKPQMRSKIFEKSFEIFHSRNKRLNILNNRRESPTTVMTTFYGFSELIFPIIKICSVNNYNFFNKKDDD